MIGPLVQYAQSGGIRKTCHAVLCDDSHAEAGDQLVYAVVDLLVDVVRTACDNYDLAPLCSCLLYYFHSLAGNGILVGAESFIGLVHSIGYPALDIVSAESLSHDLYDVLPDIQVKIRVYEVITVEPRVVCDEELGIVGNNRAVEVVVAFALVYIVAHAGVEYEIHALVEEILDMSVSELCGIADRIRRNGVLSEIVHITGALIGNNRPESQCGKEHMPEGQLLVEAQCKGKSHSAAVTLWLMRLYGIEYTVILEFIEIGDGVPVGHAAALFAAVAGYEAPALSEADYVQLTVCGTAAAVHRTGGI